MNDYSIKVENISKSFSLPHENITSMKGAFVNVFRSKSYETLHALDDVSFEVKKGEFFGVVGRNGSGKSTLLKILAGIYAPDSGTVRVNGEISPFLELGIGFNPELSGRDNVYLNATVLGMTKKDIDNNFDNIIAFSELRPFIDQKLKNYSSGMKVRLAFSVSIHAKREILLMDEVLAVGDRDFQQKCLSYFTNLKNQGKTIVFVSHSEEAVKGYCDRAILLSKGKIIEEGSPEKLFTIYNNSFLKKESKNVEFSSFERWGTNDMFIDSVEFDKQEKVYQNGEPVLARITIQIKNPEIIKVLHEVEFSVGMYDFRNALVCFDACFIAKFCEIDYAKNEMTLSVRFDLPNLSESEYRYSFHLSKKSKTQDNEEVIDHWEKSNTIQIVSPHKSSGVLRLPSVFTDKVFFIGLIRMRNEADLLQDTLDHMSKIVDKIIVYDDASTDESVEIALKHPAVLHVIENKVWKKNRYEEETRHRQELLEYAQKFTPEWLMYVDCDERFDEGIREFIYGGESKDVDCIHVSLFDAYMTPKDKKDYKRGQKLYNFRTYFGPERRDIRMIWRNKPEVKFEGLDKREPKIEDGNSIVKFYC
jgi:ABC-type polysaccharide/polyol phosphate transport system ATPase subunit